MSANCRCAAAFLRFSVVTPPQRLEFRRVARLVVPRHAHQLGHHRATQTPLQVHQQLESLGEAVPDRGNPDVDARQQDAPGEPAQRLLGPFRVNGRQRPRVPRIQGWRRSKASPPRSSLMRTRSAGAAGSRSSRGPRSPRWRPSESAQSCRAFLFASIVASANMFVWPRKWCGACRRCHGDGRRSVRSARRIGAPSGGPGGRESAGDCHSPALEPSATETTHAFTSLSSPGISHRFCGGD